MLDEPSLLFGVIQAEETHTILRNAFHNQLLHQWRDFMIHQTTTATTARTAIQDKHPSLSDSLFCPVAASSPLSRQRASISARVFCCSSDSITTSPPLHLGPASSPTRIESEFGMRKERFELRSVSVEKCLVSTISNSRSFIKVHAIGTLTLPSSIVRT